MHEHDELLAHLRNFGELTPKDEELVKQYFEVRNVEKNEILLNAGETCQYIYYISKGVIRTFHITANGIEFTRLIRAEKQFVTILQSFLERLPSVASIQSMEKGKLLCLKHSDFQDFISQSDFAKKIYTGVLEEFENFHLKRLEFLTSYTPKEKTEIFLKENPDLDERLTDKVISSYLQITPETYCRAKKSLKK